MDWTRYFYRLVSWSIPAIWYVVDNTEKNWFTLMDRKYLICAVFCADLQTTEIFKENGGPKIVVGILSNEREDVKILDSCFSVVAAAATGNEVLKESFMDMKIDEIIFQILKENNGESIPSIYNAIHVILSSDDNRVLASQVSRLLVEVYLLVTDSVFYGFAYHPGILYIHFRFLVMLESSQSWELQKFL